MGWLDVAIGIGGAVVGGIVQKKAAGEAEERVEAGAREQADIERLNRLFRSEQFQKDIARQQPMLEAGERALPEYIKSLRGEATGVSPTVGIRSDMVREAVGSESPEFILEEAGKDIGAVESERRKGRLANLINVGLGGVGSTTASQVDLGTTLGRSLQYGGSVTEAGLTEAATMRQNQRNRELQALAGIPAAAYTIWQNRPQSSASPYTSSSNPLGLTPGQGL
ncbi:MAG: hypothetical protein GY800_09055 [Planctomycetes bacterium]|nr:hypothetical protein [Planctomycetota bacterium]